MPNIDFAALRDTRAHNPGAVA
ncbi:MAG: hypothetical protein RL247_390, partial [Actinomycetota bacterium]